MFKSLSLLLYFMMLLTLEISAQSKVIIPFKSTWKYLDNGTSPNPNWFTIEYDDSGWGTGAAKFGYGIDDANTLIYPGPNAKKKYITTYFRKIIAKEELSGYTSYSAKVNRDDGVVVYVNGVEVYRNNMPTGTISYLTTAAGDAKDNGNLSYSFIIDATNFRSGVNNIVAVEVHQHRANSPDMAFDLELTAESTVPPINQPPTVSISSPINNASFTTGQTIEITATANDPEESLARVEFFVNESSLGSDEVYPYSISWSPISSGDYILTAKATDGVGNSTTSANIIIKVIPPPADQIAPEVISINRQEPATETTNATSVVFRVSFSESVSGVDETDFNIFITDGNLTAHIASVRTASADGSVYDVIIDQIQGNSKLRLDLKDNNTGIRDASGNSIQSGFISDQVYIVNQTPTNTTSSLLISYKSRWKYIDNGTNQGIAWIAPSFNDDTWNTGLGKFGYGNGDEGTIVNYGDNKKKKYITTYFRKEITIADASTFTYYTVNVIRDDGVVVYVNGIEVYRNNMPSAGPVYYTTLASSSSYDTVSYNISASAFRSGTNIIAVEVHQNSQNSSDLSFDMELIGNTDPPPVTKPQVIYYEGFENGSGFAGMHMQTSTSYGFTIASTPTYNDNKVGRWELRAGDPPAANGTRTEVLFTEYLAQQETWHSYAGYFPSTEYLVDYDNEIFNQWHQGSAFGTPMLTFSTVNDHYEVRRRSSDGKTATYYNLGPIIYDNWVDIVIHLKQHLTDGIMQVWINGELKLNIEGGPTMFDGPYGRWKMGIYKSDWNNGATTNTTKRVWYVDEIKIGNFVCTYEIMKPEGNNKTVKTGQLYTTSNFEFNSDKITPEHDSNLAVYPTLIKQGSTFIVKSNDLTASEVIILNSSGQAIKFPKLTETIHINTKGLPIGMYFISLSGSKHQKKKKLVITN